jgi:hypothetical protein
MVKKISFKFNIVLFLFLCFYEVVVYLFEPENKNGVPWDIYYKAFPTYSVIFAILMWILLLIAGAKIVQLFWNGFVSDVFKLRAIWYQESFALVLVLSILLR